jgi:cell division septation protein DedD
MKKPDFLTIAIIVVALAGLTFLIIKTFDVLDTKEEPVEEIDKIFEEPETENYFEEEEEIQQSPVTPVNEFPKVSKDEGQFMVIAGSFKVRENAEKGVQKLKSLGYSDARIGSFNKGSLASVLVKTYDSKAEASALVAELKEKHGIEAYVQVRK